MSAALLCHTVTAMAADHVEVRTGAHDGYSRLVFDWGTPVPYTVTKSGDDTLDVIFQKPGVMDAAGVDIPHAATIRGVDKVSGDNENLKVRVKIPAGSRYRDFNVLNKIIVDVYGNVKASDDAKTAEAKPAASKAETKPVQAAKPAEPKPVAKVEPKEPVKAAPKVETKVAAVAPKTPVAPEVVHTVDTPPVPAQPAAEIEGLKKDMPAPPQVVPSVQPHVINISSTNTVGVAVFRRNDDLWVVLDRGDLSVPPTLDGPQKNLFSPFEKIAAEGGAAYRTRIPEGLYINGEGGGLVWKVNISTVDANKPEIEVQRNFAPGENVRGGTLFWPMQRVTRVVKLKDPVIGDTIYVGTVDNAAQMAGDGREFVDLSLLESPVGLAIVPKVDDVTMQPVGNGVQISRPGGLALTRARDIAQKNVQAASEAATAAAATPGMKRIFDFDRWMMGGIQALRENQQVLLSGMASKDKTGKAQDLLMLAKMNMANDRGQEAVGFLNFAESELPEIAQSPEFLALRGAAESMAGKFEVALNDLVTPSLKDYGELDYWRTYTLASLDDWQQAKEVMPKSFALLRTYPLKIQERLILKLTEVALRSGNVGAANELLNMLEQHRSALQPWTLAGMEYFSGEKHHQANENKQAIDSWTPLTQGKDDLYRAKASLALTMLQLQNKEITPAEAIDRLEGLRYHWRGDELEAQVNFMLGKLYLIDGRYQKAFTILKDATIIAPDADISREIATYLITSFKDMFLTDKIKAISPVDAATIYEDFPELTPQGDEGNRMIQRLAERLVDADLLDRAAALLKNLVDTRLTGRAAADVALRLAAIDLLNDNSAAALVALDKSSAAYAALEQNSEIAQKQKDIQLLRARALSKIDKVADALAILNKYPPSQDVSRLRADIAWNAGMWADAAEALQNLIVDEPIDVARPLTQKQTDLILNRAVALNLSGDRVALANMRTKYVDQMAKTPRAKMFDVVTRQRTGSLSSDRESIAALVSEVDLFKDFLDSYRADGKPSQ